VSRAVGAVEFDVPTLILHGRGCIPPGRSAFYTRLRTGAPRNLKPPCLRIGLWPLGQVILLRGAAVLSVPVLWFGLRSRRLMRMLRRSW
jgi:hypothetical protein